MISISSDLSNIITGVREKVPIGMIWVYDTTNTVPRVGPYVRYYTGIDPTISGSIKRTQFENSIFNDWSNGIPAALSDYSQVTITPSGTAISTPFTVIYSGYFIANTSGDYDFNVKMAGAATLTVNGTSLLTGVVGVSGYSSGCVLVAGSVMYASGFYDNKPQFWGGSINLNTGCHEYVLTYKWDRSQLSGANVAGPFIAAYYNLSGQDSKVVTASALDYRCEEIQPDVISDFIYIDLNTDNSLSTVCSFEVPVTTSGTYAWDMDNQEFGFIKPNRLVKVFVGYATRSGYDLTSGYTRNLDLCTDMVHKFTGFIDSAKLSHSKDNSVLVVECRDFSKKMLNALNENYPNKVSYSDDIINRLDPNKSFDVANVTPMAWDRWGIKDVIETLAIHGGIDPAKINKSKWDIQNHFIMESNLNWPSTSTIDGNGVETKNADPYVFKFEYGEKLYDEMKRVADLIGYNVYFDEVGDLVFKEPRATNRIEVYETTGYGVGTVSWSGWSLGLDINAYNRMYVDSMTSGVPTTSGFYFGFSGVGCGIRYMQYPSGSNYTVVITRDSDLSVMLSGSYSSSGVLTNNTLNEVTRSLASDSYTTKITSTGSFRVEGIEYYTTNIFEPVRTLYDSVDITSINMDFTDTNLRNEVIAVGQQIGDKQYLYSKSIDLDSIYNPSAFNYVGDKRTFVLIEPTIQSKQRLDWMSSAILEKYRRNSRNLSISTQGLPDLQINDPIGIRVSKIDLDSPSVTGFDINNEQVYYITQMNSRLTRASYTTNLSLTNIKPIESWRPSLSITDDILDLIFAQNGNTIFSTFTQNTLNSNAGYGYDPISEQAAFMSFNLWVDVDRLWVLIADDETEDIKTGNFGNVLKAINPKEKTPTIEYYEWTDPQGTVIKNPKGAVWLHNGGGERWGNITVPTLANKFGDGQWIGQKSDGTGRKDGVYPVAIWAQFRSIDGSIYTQGIWIPPTGQLASGNIASGNITQFSGVNTYWSYSTQNNADLGVYDSTSATSQMVRLPGFRVLSSDVLLDMWCGPKQSGIQIVKNSRLVDLSCQFDLAGSLWNLPQQSYQDTNYYASQPPKSRKIFLTGTNRLELVEYVSGLPYILVSAEDGPFRINDFVLFEGSRSDGDLEYWHNSFHNGANRYQNGSNALADVPNTAHYNDYFTFFNAMSVSGSKITQSEMQTGGIWKSVMGWTPMACDLVSGAPSSILITGISALGGPSLNASAGYLAISPNQGCVELFKNRYSGTLVGVSGIFYTGGSSTYIRAAIYSSGNALLGQSSPVKITINPTGNYLPFPSGIPISSGTNFKIALLTTGDAGANIAILSSVFYENSSGILPVFGTGINFPATLVGSTYSNPKIALGISYNYDSVSTGWNFWPGFPYTKNKLNKPSSGNGWGFNKLYASMSTGVFQWNNPSANWDGVYDVSWGYNIRNTVYSGTPSQTPLFDGRIQTCTSPFHDLNHYVMRFNTPVKYFKINVFNFHGALDAAWYDYGGQRWQSFDTRWKKIGYADLGPTVLQEVAVYFDNAAARSDMMWWNPMWNFNGLPINSAGNNQPMLYSAEFQSITSGLGASGVVKQSHVASSVVTPSNIPMTLYQNELSNIIIVPYSVSNNRTSNFTGPAYNNVLIYIEFMQANTGKTFYTTMRGWCNEPGRITFNPWAHSKLLY